MPITRLPQLLDAAADRPRKRLVAAWANDPHTMEALSGAVGRGLVDATLVGDEAFIRKHLTDLGAEPDSFQIEHEISDVRAARRAVELVRQGHAQILMKGSLTTEILMHAILDKDSGISSPGAVLSHVSVMDSPLRSKLLVLSDPAVILEPDLDQKVAITRYLIETARVLGIERPKVALLGIAEQVNPRLRSMLDAAVISKMADRGQIQGAFVDGPMALDVAIDPESARIKGVGGPVAGDADCVLFPGIEAGNIFYKACTKLGGCEVAGMVVGARVPCVVASRGDSSLSKLYSIALAALASK